MLICLKLFKFKGPPKTTCVESFPPSFETLNSFSFFFFLTGYVWKWEHCRLMGQNNNYSVGKRGLTKAGSETPVFGEEADFLGRREISEAVLWSLASSSCSRTARKYVLLIKQLCSPHKKKMPSSIK